MAAAVTEPAMKGKNNHHGPVLDDKGAAFRVWAPERKRIELVVIDSDGREQRTLPLSREAEGYFSAHAADVTEGALYFYRIDNDPKNYPDPAAKNSWQMAVTVPVKKKE